MFEGQRLVFNNEVSVRVYIILEVSHLVLIYGKGLLNASVNVLTKIEVQVCVADDNIIWLLNPKVLSPACYTDLYLVDYSLCIQGNRIVFDD